MSPRVIDFRQFALERGVDPLGYCEPGLHNPMGFIPKAAQRRHIKMLAAKMTEHAESLRRVRAEYDRLTAAGEVRPFTSRERLERTAAGPDDNAATHAARRILARLAAPDMSTQNIGKNVSEDGKHVSENRDRTENTTQEDADVRS